MKKTALLLLAAVIFTALPSYGAGRYATSDIPLTNRYFYRLAERSMAINPSIYYTDNFKPVAVREAEVLFGNSREVQELFGSDADTEEFARKAGKYYGQKDLYGEGFDAVPLREINLKNRYVSDEDMQITGDFGEDAGDDFFNRASLSGGLYMTRFLAVDYTLGIYRNSDETEIEVERAKLKFAGKHNAYIGAVDNLQIGPGYFGQLIISDNIRPQAFAMIKTEIPYNWGFLGRFRYYIFNFWFDDDDRKNKDPQLLGIRFSLKPTDWLELAVSRTSFYGGSEMPSYGLSDYWDILTAEDENSGSEHDTDQFLGAEMSVYLPFLKKSGLFKGGKLYVEYNWNDIIAPWQTEDKGKDFKLLGESYIYGLLLTTGKTDIRFETARISRQTYLHHNYAPEGYSVEDYIIGHQIGRDNEGYYLEIYTELNETVHPYIKASYVKKGTRDSALKQKEQQYSAGAEVFLGSSYELNVFARYITQDKKDLDERTFYYDFSGSSTENYIAGFDLKYIF
ncbi:hypothetical protein EP073_12525 [Geovibrio thiophilus]|uniref:Capsule assembly Wzi family protein n=1 Tax=Geovibrio thiophilus TaxID=139438 RepID=A0A410K1D4_9BACT|nr:capsule assembly Wzi family protein [Geovibrio thiophilus]QAR34199.1 hypothetical protein EP073_12525 [Geovibrio thiophilus]